MGALQAVVHDVRPALSHDGSSFNYADAARASHEVEIVPNPDAQSPVEVAKQINGGFAPQLGSPEIAKIAEYAAAEGFRVLGFQLVDRRHNLISDPDQSEWSDHLVEAFQEGGNYRLQVALRRDLPNVFLNGVVLYLHPGVRIEVRRRGVLMTNDESRLRSFLTSAWKALRLS